MTYTWDDFQKAAQASGWGEGNGFSTADWRLAQQNPDAGISLLNAKRDYFAAKDDAGRAEANKRAESIRSAYGGYTGGVTGAGFQLNQPSPSAFQAETAPTFDADKWTGAAPTFDAQRWENSRPSAFDAERWESGKPSAFDASAYGVGTAPTYDPGQYGVTERPTYTSSMGEKPTFNYDLESDPVFQAYKKQYTREGRRATSDALGAAAAATGGIPSSYATAAASQAGDYYASQLTDKVPELYNQAYSRYLNELNQYNADSDREYNRFRDSLADWRDDQTFGYNRYLNESDRWENDRNFARQTYLDQLNQYNTDYDRAYNRYQDENDRWENDRNFARQAYLDQLNQYNTDYDRDYSRYRDSVTDWQDSRNFGYDQMIDEINSQTADRQETLQRAQLGYEVGDNRLLEEMGYDLSNDPAAWEKQYNLASLGMGVGDYAKLRELGINPDESMMNADMQYNLALAMAAQGDYSYLNRLVGQYFPGSTAQTQPAAAQVIQYLQAPAAQQTTSQATNSNLKPYTLTKPTSQAAEKTVKTRQRSNNVIN